MMQCKAVFEIFEKLNLQIYAGQFIINYSTFICPFESENCGKEGEKLQKLEYLKNEKSFFDEIKSTFHSF